MDLHEDAEKNIVTAFFELPGVKKDDVTLDAHNGRLTVTAETKSSDEHEEHGYAIRERRSGKYSRTLQLPQGIKVCAFSSPPAAHSHGFIRTMISKLTWKTVY